MIATNAYTDILAQSQIDDIAEKCMKIKPLVAIRCITYNHEPYIRDALEGFVMQRTTFPFVAIVHDDASTDNTAAIIREYADKYPDIIKPIYETENQYSKRDGSLGRIKEAACKATGAKYIAICEGDDYWTDPLKLQKQVDFLEFHPDYSMSFSNAIVHYNDKKTNDHLFAPLETREYSEQEIANAWITPTASFCYRASIHDSTYYQLYEQSGKFIAGDYPLMMCILRAGKVFAFKEPFCVYRIHENGWTQKKHSTIKLIQQEIEVHNIFGGEAGKAAKKNAAIQSRESISLLAKGNITEGFKTFSLSFKFAPWLTIKENIKFALKLAWIKIYGR